MKRFFNAAMAFGLIMVIFASCASSQGPSVGSVKRSLKGTWVVNNISFEGMPQNMKVTTVFSGIPYKCLEGSVWTFPPNYYGSYAISSTATDCNPMTQKIVWSNQVQNGAVFLQFKEIYEGEKAKNVTEGYRMEISNMSETSMTWKAPVNVSGQTAYVIYNLSRQ
ncbi:lipocalin family protein [Chitinophaga caeni]|nr:lipocalin family protein [Chitinophaga caeni]